MDARGLLSVRTFRAAAENGAASLISRAREESGEQQQELAFQAHMAQKRALIVRTREGMPLEWVAMRCPGL